MLIDVLNNYSNRLGFDFDFSAINESSDDYLDVTDPDLDFSIVRSKILLDKVLSRKVVNQTIVSLELFDALWDNGNKINAVILLSVGSLGFGIRAKVMVKTVDVVVDGNVKSFLSIDAYNSYMNAKSVGV